MGGGRAAGGGVLSISPKMNRVFAGDERGAHDARAWVGVGGAQCEARAAPHRAPTRPEIACLSNPTPRSIVS